MEGETLNSVLREANKCSDVAEAYTQVVEDIMKMIRETPNDYDLGEKVRSYGIHYLGVLNK
jgi:hypothetical protein